MPETIETEYVFSVQAKVAEPIPVGKVYTGNRVVAHVTGGTVKGPNVNATILGGGDWIHVGDNGIAKLDVRLTLKTDDGAIVYAAYTGILEMNASVQAAFGGGSTTFEDQYFRSIPVFETASEKHQWLTKSAFIGKGRFEKGDVVYDVFRIK